MTKLVESLKTAPSFIGEYFDLLLAMFGGIAVAILGLTKQVEHDRLAEATLLVLAALSAGLVRERWRREHLGDAVRDVLDLNDTKAPWEALEAEYSWEIMDDTGARADAASRKVLRFLQTETLTIYEFSGAPGAVRAHHCEGRWPKTEPFKDLPVIRDDFPGRQGKRYTIVSLEAPMARGQMLEVLSTRQLESTFTEEHEYVQVSVEVPTGEVTLAVTWPDTRAPRNVKIEQGSAPPMEIAGSSIEQLDDGRRKYRHTIHRPSMGEKITLSWDW